jgi:tight adherence protein C
MLLGYLGALAVGAGLWLVVTGLARRPGAAALAAVTASGARPGGRPAPDAPLRARVGAPLLARLATVGRRMTPGDQVARLRASLDNAGVALPVQTLLALRAVAVGAALLAALAWVALGAPGPAPLVLVAAVAAGWALPRVVLAGRGRARQEAIDGALPETLDLLALTVQAGLGLEQGVAEVAAEADGPLGEELGRFLREQQLGRSRREALTALRERNASDDLAALVGALLHADRLGTPVADTLRVQARELRRRRRAAARERAGKAPVKLLFPLILGIFPAMFVVLVGPGVLSVIDALFR